MLNDTMVGQNLIAEAHFATHGEPGTLGGTSTPHEGDPYREMWRSVLIRAIFDLHAPHQMVDRLESEHDHLRLRKRRRRLAGWFEEKDADTPGAFAWICEAIGYDPDDVRNILSTHLERGSKTINAIRGWRVASSVLARSVATARAAGRSR